MDAQEALQLLDSYIVSRGLRVHCVGVGKVTKVVAQALQCGGQRVNVERATLMGLIHDIGREQSNNERHGIEGYKLAREAGVPVEIARICITHMTMGRTADAAIAIGLFTESEAQSRIEDDIDLTDLCLEEKIVCLADSHVVNGEFVTLAERIAELESRKGPLTAEHWYNLDQIAEFVRCVEQLAGHLLTDLFDGRTLAEIDFWL